MRSHTYTHSFEVTIPSRAELLVEGLGYVYCSLYGYGYPCIFKCSEQNHGFT